MIMHPSRNMNLFFRHREAMLRLSSLECISSMLNNIWRILQYAGSSEVQIYDVWRNILHGMQSIQFKQLGGGHAGKRRESDGHGKPQLRSPSFKERTDSGVLSTNTMIFGMTVFF